MKTRAIRIMLFVAATLGLAAPTRAETLLSGAAGLAFGGRTDDSKATYGGTLTFKGPVFGVAVDFGYTPDFFGTTGFGNNNLVTLMGNLVVSSPGPVRVYATAGLGLIKSKVEDADGFFRVDSNDLGVDAGAGILIFPRDGRVGFHADLRYFRNLTDPERDDEFDVDLGDIDYWRGEAGITIRF
jgi:hypothetical protein